mgnify:CR=1 FL=1
MFYRESELFTLPPKSGHNKSCCRFRRTLVDYLYPLLLVLLIAVACGGTAAEPQVVEKEVIKEVIKEVPKEVEVVKEVEVTATPLPVVQALPTSVPVVHATKKGISGGRDLFGVLTVGVEQVNSDELDGGTDHIGGDRS